jgi:hypothetical protein
MIMSKIWTIFPVLGIPVLTLGPKNPSNQSSNKITMIVSSIISLFFSIFNNPVRVECPSTTHLPPADR